MTSSVCVGSHGYSKNAFDRCERQPGIPCTGKSIERMARGSTYACHGRYIYRYIGMYVSISRAFHNDSRSHSGSPICTDCQYLSLILVLIPVSIAVIRRDELLSVFRLYRYSLCNFYVSKNYNSLYTNTVSAHILTITISIVILHIVIHCLDDKLMLHACAMNLKIDIYRCMIRHILLLSFALFSCYLWIL